MRPDEGPGREDYRPQNHEADESHFRAVSDCALEVGFV